MLVSESNISAILAKDVLSLDDVKRLIRGVRYPKGYDERFEYANTLLADASDYLRPDTLIPLVRAEITESEAVSERERNKAFFARLVDLLPSIVRFFSKEARSRNPWGIVSTIDDCHHDFHITIKAPRRDRQLRTAKEKLSRALKLALELMSSLEAAKRYFDIEYDRYRGVQHSEVDETRYALDDLMRELRMCSGVLELVGATADLDPRRLILFGNDEKTDLVEWTHHMCAMWGGPKLVTTPGSDFATLCSLMFEVASGNSEEGLAGAINRYARSEPRKQWDRGGENEEERESDNFVTEKRILERTTKEIAFARRLLQTPNLTDNARAVLQARIQHEQRRYEDAERRHGPLQVYREHMTEEQWRAKTGYTPEIEELMPFSSTQAAQDVEIGRKRRSERKPEG